MDLTEDGVGPMLFVSPGIAKDQGPTHQSIGINAPSFYLCVPLFISLHPPSQADVS